MSDSIFSSSWYRVADLKPRISANISIQRQHYRGQIWYILHDQASGRHHRFNTMAYQFIDLLDGQYTVRQIWDILLEHYDDDVPGQDEIIQILGQLHQTEIMQCEITPDSAELFQRYQQHKFSAWKNSLKNPLAIRIPILDPDPFLNHCLPFLKPLFNPLAFILWLIFITYGVMLGVSHYAELTSNMSDRILSSENLLLLALLYPLIKLLHELGHAFATKVWGGEVHEMGFTLLALIPNPYVNTTAAYSFPQKRQRIIVSAAGMMVELFLASSALILWVSVEPGVVRALAFNTIIIASVTTLLFNANPLLRFDGYYILSDFLDIPNLGSRANQHIAHLTKRYLLGITQSTSPATSYGEKSWLFFYGLAAFFYRLFILFAITLMIAGKFFFVGVILAIWVILTQIIMPVFKHCSFLLSSPLLRTKRDRVAIVSSVILTVFLALIFMLPVANNTIAEGVMWLPEQAQVRTETEGFVSRLLATEGSHVKAGDPLIESHNPTLLAQEKIHHAQLKALQVQLTSQTIKERSKAEITKDKIATVQAAIDHIKTQKKSLITRSQTRGIFTLADDQDLTGRYLKKGSLLGYVIEPSMMTARVVVRQKNIGLIREKTNRVEIKFAANLANTITAKIERQIPAASDRLPSAAMSSKGGGNFATNPADPDGLQTLEKIFQFDIRLLEKQQWRFAGSRVYAKFDHGSISIAQHIYRNMRQLFLRKFDV